MVITEAQAKALAIAPKFFAVLSFSGSSFILKEVLGKKRKRGQAFYRIMVAMSVSDLLFSTFTFLTSWPIPDDTPHLFGAVGNQQTCTMQGFFLQLGIVTPLYNFVLSLYYFLTLRMGWKQADFMKIEKYLHLGVITFGLGTSIAGLPLKLYNNAMAWCWIAPYPLDCEESFRGDGPGNCERGDNAEIYRWAFWYGPLWCIIFWVMISMTLVYRKVLSLDKKLEKYTQTYTQTHAVGFLGRKNATQAETTATNIARDSRKNSRKVATQGMFYVLSFFVTWTFPTVFRAMQLAHREDEVINETRTFWILFLLAIFAPFQGFLNFLVYIRPRVLTRIANRNKENTQQVEISTTLHNVRDDIPTTNGTTPNEKVEEQDLMPELEDGCTTES